MAMSPEQLEHLKAAAGNFFPFVSRCEVVTESLAFGHCRMRMPLAPNINHIGTMYAGALFTLAELPGGVLYLASFDTQRFYPIVKDLQIRFRRPARSDVTVEVNMAADEIARIQAAAEADGKCDYEWECELKDADGEVVALTRNLYQLRRIGS